MACTRHRWRPVSAPHGRVVACEPSPILQERLHRTVAANGLGWMDVQHIALADHAGQGVLGRSAFSETAHLVEAGPGMAVRVETVDRLLSERGIAAPDVIKIDTEGHERPVLDGARTALERMAPLVMFEVDMKQPDVTLEAGERLTALGYDIYHHVAGLTVAVPLDTCFLDGFTLNLIGCRPERARELEARGLLVTPAAIEAARLEMPPLPCQADLPWDEALAALKACLLRKEGPLAQRVVHAEAMATSWLSGLRDFSDLMDYPARLTGLVRLLQTTGARQAALEAMRPLLYRFEAGRPGGHEPGLPISPSFDGTPASSDAGWAGLALIDQMVRLRSHAAFFVDDSVLPALDSLRDHPGFSPRLERTRQLLYCRRGTQRCITYDRRLVPSRNLRFAQGMRAAA
ncbi:MAG TPA: FkbM family methyltransferase [Geminicoccus sp.]|uniref:FkbM family methyltransferase n=1 Tax=Geminicoccus sp. TaxID=2024832 RepID=UPI002E340730|nr:FkbM family methyltransferase [Geminicoccus sp.]HEX2525066.1 FkbM family methyltransferase [Geminicoccus sp.]